MPFSVSKPRKGAYSKVLLNVDPSRKRCQNLMYQLASKTKSKHDFLDIIILGIDLVKLKKKVFL
jgi:hypothetical protein